MMLSKITNSKGVSAVRSLFSNYTFARPIPKTPHAVTSVIRPQARSSFSKTPSLLLLAGAATLLGTSYLVKSRFFPKSPSDDLSKREPYLECNLINLGFFKKLWHTFRATKKEVSMESPEIGESYLEKSFDAQVTNSIHVEKMITPFTGDLTPAQKAAVKPASVDDDTLVIAFAQRPEIHFTIRRQNIFASGAEVIVNAANTHLGGGGGIDGAIHKEGGAAYAQAHRELQTLFNAKYVEGYAAMISSGDLERKYAIGNVIVVAGPQGAASLSKETELYSCYYNSLVLADQQNKTSIAFPSISTGIFGFPKDRAAAISLKAVQDFLDNHPNAQLKTISIHFLPSDPSTALETYETQAS